MNLKVSGVGADKPWKIGVLVLLVLVAGYFYFSSGTPGDSPSTTPRLGTALPGTGANTSVSGRPSRPRNAVGLRSQEFRPSLKPKPGMEVDRASIDPALRLDLLEKLQSVNVQIGPRASLFEFGPPEPVAAAGGIEDPGPIKVSRGFMGPPAPPPPAPPPPEPPAPAIPLKFYGFVSHTRAGVKSAFFLDGEDIIVAAEGQLIKNRYKIVRIGINSAVVEDTQFKNHQQTLPLVAEETS